MGSCCLCTNTTIQKSSYVVDWVGSWTPWCILGQPRNSICFTGTKKARYRCHIFLPYFLLYGSHYICTVPCKHWRNWESTPVPETYNWNVSIFFSGLTLFLLDIPVFIICLFHRCMTFNYFMQESDKVIHSRFPSWNCFEDISYFSTLHIDANV